MKEFADNYADNLTDIFNDSSVNGVFPDSLKRTDVTPLHKKGSKSKKENYRPISKLPVISKIFERILYNQLYDFIYVK